MVRSNLTVVQTKSEDTRGIEGSVFKTATPGQLRVHELNLRAGISPARAMEILADTIARSKLTDGTGKMLDLRARIPS